KAPLNEALAAGLILATGWTGQTPLVDPMCGSGSLPIEAAWIALRRPPGLTRKHFGFMGWMDFDVAQWTRIRDEARANVLKKLPAFVAGSDVRADAIEHAQTNARSAGIGNLLTFERADVKDFRPPEGPAGVVICNPPYGERVGEERELRPLYRQIGDVFAERCRGWSCFVFTANDAPWRGNGMKPAGVAPVLEWENRLPATEIHARLKLIDRSRQSSSVFQSPTLGVSCSGSWMRTAVASSCSPSSSVCSSALFAEVCRSRSASSAATSRWPGP